MTYLGYFREWVNSVVVYISESRGIIWCENIVVFTARAGTQMNAEQLKVARTSHLQLPSASLSTALQASSYPTTNTNRVGARSGVVVFQSCLS